MKECDIYSAYLKMFDANLHLRHKRWNVLKSFIPSNASSVIEFGCGVSTLLFENLGLTVHSFETDQEFAEKISQLCSSQVKIFTTKNEEFEPSLVYDIALIDGILPRMPQLLTAMKCAKLLCIDDFAGSIKNSFIPKLSHLPRLDSGDTYMAVFDNS